MTCPLCKSGMKKRVSAYGEFFGCRKYPLCKGTRKAEQEERSQSWIEYEKARIWNACKPTAEELHRTAVWKDHLLVVRACIGV